MNSLAGAAESFPSIVNAIYGAALETQQWEDVLPRALRFVGAARGVVGITSPARPEFDATFTWEIRPDLLRRWREEFQREDPVFDRVSLPPTASVFKNGKYISRADWHGLDVYKACHGPSGADEHIVAVISNGDGIGSFISAYRAEWEPAFSAEDFSRMQALAPHLVRAGAIHRKLLDAAGARAASDAVLSALPFALLALDAEGRVVSTNPAAGAQIRRAGGLALRGERLIATGRDRDALDAAISAARATTWGRGSAGGTALPIARGLSRRPLQVLVFPIPERSSAHLFGHSPREAVVGVLASDPETAEAPASEVLAHMFRLTPTLARLATAIAAGKTVSEYAEDHEVTEGTARQQLKELMARIGVRRQAELVRVLLSGVAQLRVGAQD